MRTYEKEQSSASPGAIKQGQKENPHAGGIGAKAKESCESEKIAVEEIFRVAVGHPDWQASNLGNVRRVNGNSRVGSISRLGYRRVTHYYGPRKTKPKQLSVHRLVALAWCANPNSYAEVNHINGDKLDNRPENLEWCNRSHNIRHAYSSGLRKLGGKLNADSAKEIFRRGHAGERSTDLAAEFGVKITTISSIKSRHIWKSTNP